MLIIFFAFVFEGDLHTLQYFTKCVQIYPYLQKKLKSFPKP